jgi:hypothetical protein
VSTAAYLKHLAHLPQQQHTTSTTSSPVNAAPLWVDVGRPESRAASLELAPSATAAISARGRTERQMLAMRMTCNPTASPLDNGPSTRKTTAKLARRVSSMKTQMMPSIDTCRISWRASSPMSLKNSRRSLLHRRMGREMSFDSRWWNMVPTTSTNATWCYDRLRGYDTMHERRAL